MSCASTEHYRAPVPAEPPRIRTGRIESVREVSASTDRGEDGAINALVVSLLLLQLVFINTSAIHGPGSALYGAAAGAEHTAKHGEPVPRHVEVTVRFDDGGAFTLDYPGGTVLRPGDRVALTPHGLVRGPRDL